LVYGVNYYDFADKLREATYLTMSTRWQPDLYGAEETAGRVFLSDLNGFVATGEQTESNRIWVSTVRTLASAEYLLGIGIEDLEALDRTSVILGQQTKFYSNGEVNLYLPRSLEGTAAPSVASPGETGFMNGSILLCPPVGKDRLCTLSE
jgi:hypothetical protein